MASGELTNQNALAQFAEEILRLFQSIATGILDPNQTRIPFSFLLSNFGENSSVLTAEQTAVLDELSAILLASQNVGDNQLLTAVFEVEELIGRASQTGAEAHNIQLGRQRAETVWTYLEQAGVSGSPLLTTLGSSDPIVDAQRNELAINRSVEIKLWVELDLTPLEKEIDHWHEPYHHQVPETVAEALEERDINIQGLETADSLVGSPRINLDFYQVRITTLPNKENGTPYTMPELFREIRLSMSDIISSFNGWENEFNAKVRVFDDDTSMINDGLSIVKTVVSTAGAHASLSPYSSEDELVWTSDNPLGAVMRFDSFGDDMGVVCSAYAQDHWIFTTVGDSQIPFVGDVGNHPVSGNRKFGYFQDAQGRYVVYTQGVDRTTTTFEKAMDPLVFGGGHYIWLSWQVGIAKFVRERGGTAEVLKPISKQGSYEEVKEHFD